MLAIKKTDIDEIYVGLQKGIPENISQSEALRKVYA